MIDLRLNVSDQGADLVIEDGDLGIERSLATAVLVSLFSDARASDDDRLPDDDDAFGAPPSDVQPAGFPDRRGWWSDSELDRFGSRLWLLVREKATTETATRAREFAEDALRWLVEYRIAAKVEVVAQVTTSGYLRLEVAMHRGGSSRWAEAWTREAVDESIELAGVALRLLAR